LAVAVLVAFLLDCHQTMVRHLYLALYLLRVEVVAVMAHQQAQGHLAVLVAAHLHIHQEFLAHKAHKVFQDKVTKVVMPYLVLVFVVLVAAVRELLA
jgi:hypothetical protein